MSRLGGTHLWVCASAGHSSRAPFPLRKPRRSAGLGAGAGQQPLGEQDAGSEGSGEAARRGPVERGRLARTSCVCPVLQPCPSRGPRRVPAAGLGHPTGAIAHQESDSMAEALDRGLVPGPIGGPGWAASGAGGAPGSEARAGRGRAGRGRSLLCPGGPLEGARAPLEARGARTALPGLGVGPFQGDTGPPFPESCNPSEPLTLRQ